MSNQEGMPIELNVAIPLKSWNGTRKNISSCILIMTNKTGKDQGIKNRRDTCTCLGYDLFHVNTHIKLILENYHIFYGRCILLLLYM